MYKINGMYYIMTASGGTAKEHREIIGRSSSPYGPFERLPHPILTHSGTDNPIQYLGHADLIEDRNGDWWAVFLGVRLVDAKFTVLGRETFLAPVSWTEDGWPMIDNNEDTVGLEMKVSRVPGQSPKPKTSGRYDFDDQVLPLGLAFLRNPAEGSWSLNERQGWLSLRGQSAGLSEVGQVAFVGRRQQHTSAEWSTLLEMPSSIADVEAGLCARLDENAHYEIGLVQKKGQKVITAHVTMDGITRTVAEVPTTAERIYLKVKAELTEYSFLYSLDGQEWNKLSTAAAYPLSPQAVKGNGFTGVLIGLYATGHGKVAEVPAYFDWFDYQS
ncbi:hypothetical protein BSO21_34005 [Paenibacillus odorifer]|uniref:Beta-xylosidase C-terminal Concanavalin A-like domain-containing protein n=1 Tax=Paenibacillus odorifer TaxID=189426 RepID=A0ABX3GC48_9BACL|nr:hypothetical protein BSO21_34005 [Paenibacillus odorifer]